MDNPTVKMAPHYVAQISLEGETLEKGQKLVELRKQATLLENEIIKEVAKTPVGAAIIALGHNFMDRGTSISPGRYAVAVDKSYSSNIALFISNKNTSGRVDRSLYQLDPKTLNQLLSSKLLTDQEKRDLLASEFGERMQGVLEGKDSGKALMKQVIRDLLEHAVPDYESSDECYEAVRAAKKCLMEDG